MKNKKKTFMGLALLLAVLVLGVGYALTATDLTVSGTATANQATSGFKVEFAGAEKNAGDETEITTLSAASGTAATMNVSLTNVGDEATATFTIKNASDAGMNADLSGATITVTSNDKEDYFNISTSQLTDDLLEVNETTTFTVTIELIKANIGDSAVTGNYTVTLTGIESVQA